MESDLLKQARYVWQKRGIFYVVKLLPAFAYKRTIRRLLPPTGDRYYDFIHQKYVKSKIFDDYLPSNKWLPGNKNKKRTYKNFHQSITESGSEVVIIGGGYGISTYYACQSVGENGHVTVYEASNNRVDIIDKMSKKMNIYDRCKIIHGIVGDDGNVYENDSSYEEVEINEIGPCDVLELDCEGAELSILEKIDIKPNEILCEVHGQYLDNPEEIVLILEELEYEIRGYASDSKTPLINIDGSDIDIGEKVSEANGSVVLWATRKY